MMKDVPKADVVITNPTYIAVALGYDPEKMAAPTVLAKGKRLTNGLVRYVIRLHLTQLFPKKREYYGMEFKSNLNLLFLEV